jgi:hypothetical protein
MLDTGSPNLFAAGFAKRLGLPLVRSSKKLSISGGTVDLGTTQIESLAVGGLTLHDQPFVVIDSPWDTSDPLVGVVGYEFLRRFAVKVDYDHKLLTVYDAPTFRYQGSGTGVPLQLWGISFEVNGNVDGVEGRFVLDTGNEAGFALEGEFVQQSDLICRLGAHYHGYSGRGYAGPLPDAYYARVRSLRLGEAEVHDVVAYLSNGETAGADFSGNIGQSILKQFNVTFDAMRGRLYLEKNSNWGKPGIFNRAGVILGKGDQGETVMTVLPGSPAESAGLHVGDVITAIDQKPPEDLSEQPAFLQPEGTVVDLTAKREACLTSLVSRSERSFSFRSYPRRRDITRFMYAKSQRHSPTMKRNPLGRKVVSLDRKCLGAGFSGCWGCSEAFSIRRLEGSRWQWWALLWSRGRDRSQEKQRRGL